MQVYSVYAKCESLGLCVLGSLFATQEITVLRGVSFFRLRNLAQYSALFEAIKV